MLTPLGSSQPRLDGRATWVPRCSKIRPEGENSVIPRLLATCSTVPNALRRYPVTQSSPLSTQSRMSWVGSRRGWATQCIRTVTQSPRPSTSGTGVNALGHEVECALHSVTCGLHRTVTCRLHRDDDWVNALPTQYFRDWVGHEVECALHCVLGFTL